MNHNDTMIKTHAMTKTQEDFFIKIFTSHFIARLRKGCSRFACERELEIEHNCNILTLKLMAVNVVSFSFLWCSTGSPGPTLLGDGFLYCILSASSLDPNSSGTKWPLRPDVAFLTTSRLSPSDLQLYCQQLYWPSNSTPLYNRSTPTRSLKSNV